MALELDRLGVERLIIYDSNIQNRLLNRYRMTTGHEESNDRTAKDIIRELGQVGYEAVTLRYENYVSLPLSGGFQRPPFWLADRFPGVVFGMDLMLAPILRILRLERHFAFRFLLILDRTS